MLQSTDTSPVCSWAMFALDSLLSGTGKLLTQPHKQTYPKMQFPFQGHLGTWIMSRLGSAVLMMTLEVFSNPNDFMIP